VKRKGFLLESVIMVDDTPEKLSKHHENLVRVNEFNGQEDDSELIILMQFLSHLKSVDNVRKIEKRGWQNNYT
jgi:RNA polymerase II subunit A small phosphatase-like protein